MVNVMTEIGERVARIEGELKNINETVIGIKAYLERSTLERTAQHALIIERLTRTEAKQDAMAASVERYQNECTSDRAKIEGRMDGVEKKQTWQSGIAAGVAAVVSFVGWSLGYLKP